MVVYFTYSIHNSKLNDVAYKQLNDAAYKQLDDVTTALLHDTDDDVAEMSTL